MVTLRPEVYSTQDIVDILRKFPFEDRQVSKPDKISFSFQQKNSTDCKLLRSEWDIPENLVSDQTLKSAVYTIKWYKQKFAFSKSISDGNGIETLIETAEHSIIYKKIEKEEIPFTPFFETLFYFYVLISLGYKARIIKCTTLGFGNKGKFFVELYITDYNKWIVIDVVNGVIFFNEKDQPLNILDIRNSIIANKHLIIYSCNTYINSNIYKDLIFCLFKIVYLLNNKIDFLCDKRIEYYILAPHNLKLRDKIVEDSIENKEYCYYYSDSISFIYNI